MGFRVRVDRRPKGVGPTEALPDRRLAIRGGLIENPCPFVRDGAGSKSPIRSGRNRNRRQQTQPPGAPGELAVVEGGHVLALLIAGMVRGIR